MSSKIRSELKNEHIWQYNDLDSSSVSIVHLDRQLIENVYAFKSKLNEIESKCECAIKAHGADSQQKGVVWIRIQGKSVDSRRDAIKLLNELTGNACREIIIPKLSKEHAKRIVEVNESLVIGEPGLNSTVLSTSSSISSSLRSSIGSDNRSIDRVKSSIRRPLMRSSTENFISCLEKNEGLTSFGLILAPLTIHDEEEKDEESGNGYVNEKLTKKTLINYDQTLSSVGITDLDKIVRRRDRFEQAGKLSQQNFSTSKQIYSLDFLLSRAEVDNSKKIPINWKELGALYPEICFSGKVISYFNPKKYNEHWVRIQNLNADWHDPISWVQQSLEQPPSNKFRLRSSRTDDCISQALNFFQTIRSIQSPGCTFNYKSFGQTVSQQQYSYQARQTQQQQNFYKPDRNKHPNHSNYGNGVFASSIRQNTANPNGYSERRFSHMSYSKPQRFFE